MELVLSKQCISKYNPPIICCQTFRKTISWFHILPMVKTNSVSFQTMEGNEFLAEFNHVHLEGKTLKEINSAGVHGTFAPAFTTVYSWVNEFKRGRPSTDNEHTSGRASARNDRRNPRYGNE